MNAHKSKSILTVFSGYLFWIIIDVSSWIYYQPEVFSTILKITLTRSISGLMICTLLVLLQLKIIHRYSSKIVLSAFLIFLTAIFFSIVLSCVDPSITNYWLNRPLDIQASFSLWLVVSRLVAVLGLTGLLYVSYYRNITITQKEQIARTKALADEAQLLMLRYQINPHFLFNSLNAIQSMIEKDTSRAKDMIADLSDFFRYTLSKNNQTLVPLEEEIDAVQKYLAIQKERFADKLEIEYDIDSNSLDFKIPFFIIHPLVENSIKYGFSELDNNLKLFIQIKTAGNTLTIAVKNSGTLKNADKTGNGRSASTKIGIENIKKRLALFYPEHHSFGLFEKDHWVSAVITITYADDSV